MHYVTFFEIFLSSQKRAAYVKHHRPRWVSSLLAGIATIAIGGCAASGPAKQALEMIGINTGDAKEEPPPAPATYPLPIDFFAGTNLNAGSEETPLALVVKLYQLKDIQRFQNAAYADLLDDDREAAALGDDLISSREVLLLPRQHYHVDERMRADATELGVVALFRSPAARRWRAAFDARTSQEAGITIGLHACAMTVTRGELITSLDGPADSLAAIECPSATP